MPETDKELLNVLSPEKVCVLVETSPRATEDAFGTFIVNESPSVTKPLDKPTSLPEFEIFNVNVELANLLFVIVPFIKSPLTIEFAKLSLLYAIAALADKSPLTIVPSRIFDDVTAPLPIVITPVVAIEMSPETLIKVGIPESFAIKIWPDVPAAEEDSAPVPFPYKIPFVVNVLAPVPPLTTDNEPDEIIPASKVVVPAEVNLPCASTVKVGIETVDP